MFFKSLHVQNLLSFGPEAQPIPLGPLNVLIGPNGVGKSNLIEVVGLLKAAPSELGKAIRDGGGIMDWLWKGGRGPVTAKVSVVANDSRLESTGVPALRYTLEFTQVAQRLDIVDERVEDEFALADRPEPLIHFAYLNGQPHILVKNNLKALDAKALNKNESILSQRRDPETYPELHLVSGLFQDTQLYRDWTFGRYTPPRLPQPADLRNDHLEPDARNLALVLNRIRRNPGAKQALLRNLALLYEGIRDVDVSIQGGTVQLFFQEENWVVPATRLSDGTLRWLSLLAILLDPEAEFPVCIEEPEMGLHPDVLPVLAQLLKDASQRRQLIVTTHSDALVDALSDTPESVLVCEKHEGSTVLRRLDKESLSEWLQKYTLGQLWRRGELGGNRW